MHSGESTTFLRADRIVASYRTGLRRSVALRNVSFTAAAGSVTALVGPNGAGKTTMFHVLAGFLRPRRGTCTVEGLDPGRYRLTRGIGYLPENPVFPAGWAVRRILARAVDLSVPSENRGRALNRVIERSGLEAETLAKLVHRCSKGIRQRVALAFALAGDPRLLLLDEPFSGLDPRARVDLRRSVRSARERGAAVLMASHDLAEVERLADKTLVLHRGELRVASEQSSADQPLASALESELVQLK